MNNKYPKFLLLNADGGPTVNFSVEDTVHENPLATFKSDQHASIVYVPSPCGGLGSLIHFDQPMHALPLAASVTNVVDVLVHGNSPGPTELVEHAVDEHANYPHGSCSVNVDLILISPCLVATARNGTEPAQTLNSLVDSVSNHHAVDDSMHGISSVVTEPAHCGNNVHTIYPIGRCLVNGDQTLISPILVETSAIWVNVVSDLSLVKVVAISKVLEPLCDITNPNAPIPINTLGEDFPVFFSDPSTNSIFCDTNRALDVVSWHDGECVLDRGTRSGPIISISNFVRALSECDRLNKAGSVYNDFSLASWNNNIVESKEVCSLIRVLHM